ncbi:MAG: hypothetical protein G01um101433_21, partial [Parcubacteria group bacterium Gr01-1014_33]
RIHFSSGYVPWERFQKIYMLGTVIHIETEKEQMEKMIYWAHPI